MRILVALGVLISSGHALAQDYYRSPITNPAFDGDLAKIKELIRKGHPVNDPRSDIQPLDGAVWSRKIDVVKYLIQAGAKPNYVGPRNNDIPLAAACRDFENTHDMTIVKYLVEQGAAINPPVKSLSWTPLEGALCCYAKGHNELIDFLLAKGAKLNPRPGKASVLQQALEGDVPLDLIKQLASKGMRLHASANDEWGMLLYGFDRQDVLDYLLANGYSLKVRMPGGGTLLHYFAVLQPVGFSSLQYLLKQGLDPLAKNKDGLTALQLAKQQWDKSEVALDRAQWQPAFDLLESAEKKARAKSG